MHIRNYEVATDVAGRRHFRHPAWQRSPAVPPGEAGTAVPAVRWQRHPAEHLPGDEQSPERNGIGAGSVAKQRRRERDSRVETLKARVRQHQPATPLTLHLPGICLGTVDKKPACGDFSLAYLFSFLFNWLSLSLWLEQCEKGGRAEWAVENRHLWWEPENLLKRHRCVVATGCHLGFTVINRSGVKKGCYRGGRAGNASSSPELISTRGATSSTASNCWNHWSASVLPGVRWGTLKFSWGAWVWLQIHPPLPSARGVWKNGLARKSRPGTNVREVIGFRKERDFVGPGFETSSSHTSFLRAFLPLN